MLKHSVVGIGGMTPLTSYLLYVNLSKLFSLSESIFSSVKWANDILAWP